MKQTHTASCHCGAVQLALNLPDGIIDLRRCDCSMCRRRGTIVTSAELDGLKVVAGKDKLSLYQFNSGTAKHYFCSVCGIYTHHQRRSNPNQFGVNVGCIEGVNPYELTGVTLCDGVNHPADRLVK
ncbi:aldehyde-activating protein [Shewanella sp. Choline-02u-19]|uniref:GFA family protein n=1 Tax=unclassified Shewanella TaxID=196818 RepID=UPI000C327E6B|nr:MULTISPECIES: GFA family protein [unclassified Shewanella]PKG57931.1 aldehyde-activating protein [Shewanella sp. GutDb-MelDb]PKH60334.1 aldehyde-activating protein [Shewanella sp. Bg11-22]PKI29859.1 aldehyde-activating protein [Shewanella sp. Choline-02u-19]